MPTTRRRTPAVTAALAGVLAVVLGLTACGGSSGAGAPSTSPAATTHTSSSSPTPTPTKSRTKPHKTRAQLRAEVTKATRALIAKQPDGAISVAELNTATGAQFTAGAHGGMWTASTYKLFLLVALMLRNGGDGANEAAAQRAIENSDNVAGYQLFLSLGGNAGMESALDRLGMNHTVPGGSDPTFTRTSAMDYLRLLKTLVHNNPLSAGQRNYAIGLMQQVERDQRWGVGVVADKGDRFANKNGWLSIDNNGPGESDNGLWAVNSVGVMKVHGQQVLMAVFTEHNSDYATGVRLVQKLARTIIPAVAP